MNGTNDVSCHEVMHHICDNLGEDLQSERCRAIKQHLETCTCCQNYFSSVETTIEFYRNYTTELPEAAHKRLLDCLDLPDCGCE